MILTVRPVCDHALDRVLASQNKQAQPYPLPDAEKTTGKFHGITSLGYWRRGCLARDCNRGLFGLDICFAYDVAVLLVLFAKMRAEVHAAHSDGKEPKVDKLPIDLRCLQCRNQPAS